MLKKSLSEDCNDIKKTALISGVSAAELVVT
jgi:hypothetical protein